MIPWSIREKSIRGKSKNVPACIQLGEPEIEAIVRDHFYTGPMGGSTKRLCDALNELIKQKASQ